MPEAPCRGTGGFAALAPDPSDRWTGCTSGTTTSPSIRRGEGTAPPSAATPSPRSPSRAPVAHQAACAIVLLQGCSRCRDAPAWLMLAALLLRSTGLTLPNYY